MGHTKGFFDFSLDVNREAIVSRISDWSYKNGDLEERGFPNKETFVEEIVFMNKTFNTRDEALDYTEKKTDRSAIAVKYKEYPPFKPTAAMNSLLKRIKEYRERIAALGKPHYAGVKQATIKCKCCGASLPTAYCGKSYFNQCPVCRAELRPQSTLDKLKTYEDTLKDLNRRYDEEVVKQNKKNASKAKIKWLVCCDVHH